MIRYLSKYQLIPVIFAIACATHANGQEAGSRTQLVLSTYRIENPKSTATGFVVSRQAGDSSKEDERFLVTVAHTFQKMEGTEAKLVLRHRDKSFKWSTSPTSLTIRRDGKPTWHQHKKHDVAVLRLQSDLEVHSVPQSFLAIASDWREHQPEPGAQVRCVGFPHAAGFRPSKSAFPLTRLGCISSYPIDYQTAPMFLVDYNTFEGDSGGLVYWESRNDRKPTIKIIGLVHGQHFLDEKYKTIYQQGLIKKRLGLAIIVNSEAILETLDTW